MGTYLYTVRRTGAVGLKTPKGKIVAHPIRFLFKFHYSDAQTEQRQQLQADNAHRAWEGRPLPEYVFFDSDERRDGELSELVRWEGGPTWTDCYPMRGRTEAFVRFTRTPGGRWQISFVPARTGLLEEWMEQAEKARAGRITVFFASGKRTGAELADIYDQVVAWLQEQDIPDLADVSEWNKQAHQRLAGKIPVPVPEP